MRIWKEKYGCDADGNRGVMMTFYELENTQDERWEIAEKLYESFVDLTTVKMHEIEYEDIVIEVELDEYYPELLEMLKEDKDLDISDKVIVVSEYFDIERREKSWLVEDRYEIYHDGTIYDTEEAKDIPPILFTIRDILCEDVEVTNKTLKEFEE